LLLTVALLVLAGQIQQVQLERLVVPAGVFLEFLVLVMEEEMVLTQIFHRVQEQLQILPVAQDYGTGSQTVVVVAAGSTPPTLHLAVEPSQLDH